MDQDFLNELDNSITNLGIDKNWERIISGKNFLFSPISYEAQIKINETLSNEQLGTSVLSESKRVILSNAIVGIEGKDLRPFRDSGSVFPILNHGKHSKVSLSDYLYHKMRGWDSQLIDDLFSVYADIVEINKKDNLKDIKFETVKDPLEEMNELVIRIAELRDQLGLPHFIDPLKQEVSDSSDVESKSIQEVQKPKVQEPEAKTSKPDEFNPFKKIDVPSTQVSEPAHLRIPNLNQDEFPEPVSIPTVQIEHIDKLKDASTSATSPYVPKSALSGEVIDSRSINNPSINKIQLDNTPQNRNPRFSPPK